jgi:hypothetical protein
LGDGHGLLHVVTARTVRDNILTWSEPVDDESIVGGFSWFGPLHIFRHVLKPAPVDRIVRDPPFG